MGRSGNRDFPTPGGATLLAPDIWRIVLPTPWPVGPVNAYLIDDDPLTLFDTGAGDEPTVAALSEGLRACGYGVADLERIVLSHQHIDHWGLAASLARRSGAEVCALAELAPWLAGYPDSLAREDRFADELLERHGADPAVSSAGVYRGDVSYGASVEVTHPLHDGDLLEFAGRWLTVFHRPGHSPSDTVFCDLERGVMIGADHVMAKPSVPILSPPLAGSPGDRRPRALADYRASLSATQSMALDVILPGHGDIVTFPQTVIAERLAGYDRMTERVAAAVDREPHTAIEIAAHARRRINVGSAFYVLCDTLGYLDELLDAGQVVETEEDGMARFAIA
jgi:glyoxylase-like metal-dependent hydrolase (beta-lactamase superfamily II)